MTETVYFDTDCLSAFLWVNNQSLLAQLYPGRIVLPKEVYIELSNPGVERRILSGAGDTVFEDIAV